MKKQPIESIYSPGDVIIVTDRKHTYYDVSGIVERLGSAGEHVTYVICKLENVTTSITLSDKQLAIKDAKKG